jgi:hypothetical protein
MAIAGKMGDPGPGTPATSSKDGPGVSRRPKAFARRCTVPMWDGQKWVLEIDRIGIESY